MRGPHAVVTPPVSTSEGAKRGRPGEPGERQYGKGARGPVVDMRK